MFKKALIVIALLVGVIIAFADCPMTETYIRDAETRIDGAAAHFDGACPEAVDLYHQAVNLIAEAWTNYRAGNCMAARHSADLAIETFNHANTVLEGCVTPPPPDCGPFLDETDGMIEAHRASFDGAAEDIVAVYAEAVRLEAEARASFEDGDCHAAIRLSNMARETLSRAVRMLGETPPPPTDHTDLLDFINENDAIITELTPLVTDAGRPELTDMLNMAVGQNRVAHDQYDLGNYAFAAAHAHSARDVLERLRRLLAEHHGEDGVTADRCRTECDRTDEIIADCTARCGSMCPMMREMLDEAISIEADARAALDAGDYRECLAMTMRARGLCERCSHGSRDPSDVSERVLAELGITDEAIARVTPIVEGSGNADAIAMLNSAVELQATARTSYDAADYTTALEQTRQARRLAAHSASMCDREGDPTEVHTALTETDNYITDNSVAINASGNADAIALLTRATEIQAAAWTSYDAGDWRAAMANTMTARNLVRHALTIIGG